MKPCFKCGQMLALTEFYPHPRMADGHLNKCKQCAKHDVRTNYSNRREQYSRYERQRNTTAERRAKKSDYQKSRNAKYPDKHKARYTISNGIKSGKIIPQSCKYCGDVDTEAHHSDYSQPLMVEWLCFKCHREKAHGQTVTVLHANRPK